METVVHEIRRASATLQLPPTAIRELPDAESREVYAAALNRFVSTGDRRWWWEAFREPGTSRIFEGAQGWKYIPRILPDPTELVWFIAEDDQLPQYPVFETTPEFASAIIGECYGFEYYLIAKDLNWLVCETHHNALWAVGTPVEQRLVASEA